MNTPTPRTDDVETTSKYPVASQYYGLLAFARQLERELFAMTEAAKQAVMERDDARNALLYAMMHVISAPNTPDPTTP
jgi:hypothetical protein